MSTVWSIYGIRWPDMEVKTITLVVQMRLDSSRLAQKALLPLGSGCLADAVLRRLSKITADHYVLACDQASRAAFEPIAARAGFVLFAGPKDDVLARFCQALDRYPADYLIRATGDNPFVSPGLAAALIRFGLDCLPDYTGYLGMPSGLGVEFVRTAALYAAAAQARDPYEREHVCPFLYRNREAFRVEQPLCPPLYHMPEGRITIDTQADYERACRIVSSLGQDPDDKDLMDWLRNEGAA